MSAPEGEGSGGSLEDQIGRWRGYLHRRQGIHSVDVAELEDHLREQIDGLVESGLSEDEAFVVAVKRMGEMDALSREFAREHSDRLWKQLVLSSGTPGEEGVGTLRDTVAAFLFAVTAALILKAPELLGFAGEAIDLFYARNASLLVFPVLFAHFAWKRRLERRYLLPAGAAFLAAAIAVNLPFFVPGGDTQILAALHLPIALWGIVGIGYAGGRWGREGRRMDFVRFSGELFIYYVLIALGGGVLTGFTFLIFESIGVDVEPFVEGWLIPCGAAGAVVIAAWLVEAKQSVIENMAPVLTRLFTPLFAAVLVTFLGVLLWTGGGIDIEREVLIAFDLLLAVVLGLLLYSVSARAPGAPPGFFDLLQVGLVLAALAANALALHAIGARIREFGFTPNRVAALGENLVLLVNLAWSAVLYLRFLRGRGSFSKLERWQTDYLPVYVIWAAFVVVLFPVIFGYR